MKPRFRFVIAACIALTVGVLPRFVPPALAQTGSRFCASVDVAELGRPYVFRDGLTREQLQTDFFSSETGLTKDGYRPRRLTGYRT